MKAGPLMVQILVAAAAGAVVSSAVASPWRLPRPLRNAVTTAVDAATDVWLSWQYGIDERPPDPIPDEPSDAHARDHVRAAAVRVWQRTREAAARIRGYARRAVVFVAKRVDLPEPARARPPTPRPLRSAPPHRWRAPLLASGARIEFP